MKSFIRFIREDFDPEKVKRANSTSRNMGAVGEKAVVPKFVESNTNKSESILDFGSGKDAAHSKRLREKGFTNVTSHDFGSNVNSNHDVNALDKKYDHVFASNVLNTQGDNDMLGKTLDQIKSSVKPTGRFTANLPSNPLLTRLPEHGNMSDSEVKSANNKSTHNKLVIGNLHNELSKRFSDVSRVEQKGKDPIFHCKGPK